MSDLTVLLVAVVAATPAVCASYWSYRASVSARAVDATIKAAAMEAPTSLTGERRVVLRTTRDGVTQP